MPPSSAARTRKPASCQRPSSSPITHLSKQEIIDYVAERVAPYKKIRLVEFIDAIPKNPSGKILRRELIERERAAVAV